MTLLQRRHVGLCFAFALVATMLVMSSTTTRDLGNTEPLLLFEKHHRSTFSILHHHKPTQAQQDAAIGVTEQSVEHEGRQRTFMERLPDSFVAGNPALLMLHGRVGNSRTVLATDSGKQLLKLADDEGMLLLLPEAGVTFFRGLNDMRPDFGADQDDVGFVEKVAMWAINERGVNPDKLFVAGPSDGGIMAYTMLLERPGLFKAAAALIASMPQRHPVYTGYIPTPLLILHGSKDPLMGPKGGAVLPFDFDKNGWLDTQEATLDYWKDANKVNPSATTTNLEPDLLPDNKCKIESTLYAPMDVDGAPLQYYRMIGGGHVVPNPGRLKVPGWERWVLGKACGDTNMIRDAYEFMMENT